jgi:hypothetical protein
MGEVAFLGPLGGGDKNCLYRDVRVPRRRALGLALCQLVKHVMATLRCGCAPSVSVAFKTYSASTFYAQMSWHKVWAWGFRSGLSPTCASCHRRAIRTQVKAHGRPTLNLPRLSCSCYSTHHRADMASASHASERARSTGEGNTSGAAPIAASSAPARTPPAIQAASHCTGLSLLWTDYPS